MAERISCVARSFITGDEIANALLDYACALAQAGQYDVVHIPAHGELGGRSHVRLLVGPGTQLLAEPVTAPGDDVTDPETVQLLVDRAAELRRIHPPLIENDYLSSHLEDWLDL
ncbi:MAG: hypothetical protein JWR33_2122 [Naasia sp.]|jgi:hypothetical protein|uniref:hypothetical protein n=1 Tax=Naasia sp. TaxID=2546198 RepID=UPI0026067A76|nr:hypothetical protein [Naasia sp.]MCU1571381.1 hypothetical protein [Naasia sp.]